MEAQHSNSAIVLWTPPTISVERMATHRQGCAAAEQPDRDPLRWHLSARLRALVEAVERGQERKRNRPRAKAAYEAQQLAKAEANRLRSGLDTPNVAVEVIDRKKWIKPKQRRAKR